MRTIQIILALPLRKDDTRTLNWCECAPAYDGKHTSTIWSRCKRRQVLAHDAQLLIRAGAQDVREDLVCRRRGARTALFEESLRKCGIKGRGEEYDEVEYATTHNTTTSKQ